MGQREQYLTSDDMTMIAHVLKRAELNRQVPLEDLRSAARFLTHAFHFQSGIVSEAELAQALASHLGNPQPPT